MMPGQARMMAPQGHGMQPIVVVKGGGHGHGGHHKHGKKWKKKHKKYKGHKKFKLKKLF